MMYLKSLIIGLLFLLIETAYGQTSKFEIGIEGGPSIMSLRGNEAIDSLHETTTRFSGGLFLQFNFNKNLSLRTNIAFERKGSEATIRGFDFFGNWVDEEDVKVNYDYLTMPILARVTFGKRVKYFVNAGPYFGYVLKQNMVIKSSIAPTRNEDGTSMSKRYDIGFSTGLGASVPILSNVSLSFEVRNNLGLINTSSVEVYNDGTVKTNSTNFLIGISYNISGN